MAGFQPEKQMVGSRYSGGVNNSTLLQGGHGATHITSVLDCSGPESKSVTPNIKLDPSQYNQNGQPQKNREQKQLNSKSSRRNLAQEQLNSGGAQGMSHIVAASSATNNGSVSRSNAYQKKQPSAHGRHGAQLRTAKNYSYNNQNPNQHNSGPNTLSNTGKSVKSNAYGQNGQQNLFLTSAAAANLQNQSASQAATISLSQNHPQMLQMGLILQPKQANKLQSEEGNQVGKKNQFFVGSSQNTTTGQTIGMSGTSPQARQSLGNVNIGQNYFNNDGLLIALDGSPDPDRRDAKQREAIAIAANRGQRLTPVLQPTMSMLAAPFKGKHNMSNQNSQNQQQTNNNQQMVSPPRGHITQGIPNQKSMGLHGNITNVPQTAQIVNNQPQASQLVFMNDTQTSRNGHSTSHQQNSSHTQQNYQQIQGQRHLLLRSLEQNNSQANQAQYHNGSMTMYRLGNEFAANNNNPNGTPGTSGYSLQQHHNSQQYNVTSQQQNGVHKKQLSPAPFLFKHSSKTSLTHQHSGQINIPHRGANNIHVHQQIGQKQQKLSDSQVRAKRKNSAKNDQFYTVTQGPGQHVQIRGGAPTETAMSQQTEADQNGELVAMTFNNMTQDMSVVEALAASTSHFNNQTWAPMQVDLNGSQVQHSEHIATDILSTGSYEQQPAINRKDYSCRFPSIQSQRTTEQQMMVNQNMASAPSTSVIKPHSNNEQIPNKNNQNHHRWQSTTNQEMAGTHSPTHKTKGLIERTTDTYISKSPDKKNSGTAELSLKGRAGRGLAMNQPDNYAQNKGSTVDIFDDTRQVEDNNNTINVLGINYDCEAGGAQPEEFDDEIRDSEEDSNEDDDITDNELNIQEDGESDDFGEESSPDAVERRYEAPNKVGGKRKKKKTYKRTKLEALPEDEDDEDEEEIGGDVTDNGRPLSRSNEKARGQMIAQARIQNHIGQKQKEQSPVTRNGLTNKATTENNSPFATEKKVSVDGKDNTNSQSTQLYSGNIYLMGGAHCLNGNQTGKSQATTATTAFADFSSAFGNSESALGNKAGGKRKHKTKNRKGGKSKGGGKNDKITGEDDRMEADTVFEDSLQLQAFTPDLGAPKINGDMDKKSIRQAFLLRPPNQIVTLIKSQFGSNREPWLFFPYAPFLKIQRGLPRDQGRIVQFSQEQLKQWNMTPGFKITESTHTYNCVVNSLKMAGFQLNPGTKWNSLWTGLIRGGKLKYLNEFQRINHFAGSWSLGRKDSMWRNVQRMRRVHGKAFDICPQTYIFPEDYKRFCLDREASGFKNLYIMKPAASSCGRGIRVISKHQHLKKRSGYVLCKYVSKPHLLNGYKYDLRLYVLVTSVEPLKIYLFREGLVRCATTPYSTSKSSLKQRFVHLTNYSVNKKADAYVKNQNSNVASETQQQVQGGTSGEAEEADAPVESKLNLAQLKKEYVKMGVDYDQVFASISDVLIKAMLSVEQPIVTAMGGGKHKSNCFEVYGFDILIDSKLRPWLLEVNVSPSLSSSSPLDKQIKTLLISDSMYLTGFHLFDRKKLEQEKAKKDKQRLLGFESSTKNNAQLKGVSAQVSSSIRAKEDNHEETDSPAVRRDDPLSLSPMKIGGKDRLKEPESAGLPSASLLPRKASTSCASGAGANTNRQKRFGHDDGNVGMISSSTAVKNANRLKNHKQDDKLKPFLKDTGEWPMLSATSGSAAGGGFGGGRGLMSEPAYIQTTDADMEMLADFEEEQQRRGHYTLLFPRQKNIDTYKGFFAQPRRQNLILWEYIKQGAPNSALYDYFKR